MGYGFGSLNSLPYLRTYEAALKRFENTKPIRGTTPPEYPLGKRRSKHLLIRKTESGEIQCILYRTPVITFKPDNLIAINCGGYTSAFTCAFIGAVLPRVTARNVKDNMVLDVEGGEYALKPDQTLTLTLDPQGHYKVVGAEGVREWRINRAKANNVRAPFKQFLAFYKGFVSLNSYHVHGADDPDNTDPFVAKQKVVVSAELLKQVLGTKQSTAMDMKYDYNTGTVTRVQVEREVVDCDRWFKADSKPVWVDFKDHNAEYTAHAMKMRNEWLQQRDYVCELMRSDDTEAHLKATLIVLTLESKMSQTNLANVLRSDGVALSVPRSAAENAAKNLIHLMFAEDIMEHVQLPVGKVPKTGYRKWLFSDFVSAQTK